MGPKLYISMPSGCNVEITLHLIALETPVDPAAFPHRGPPPHPRRPLKLLLLDPTHFAQHMPDMRILLFLPHIFRVRQLMRSLHGGPVVPIGGILVQQIAGEDTVAAGVLDVDVQIVAEHGDDDVEVDLELMRDALFDGEEVAFMAAVPAEELADGEEERDEDQDEGGVATGGGAAGVGRFGFG